jgi:hypothetical protein
LWEGPRDPTPDSPLWLQLAPRHPLGLCPHDSGRALAEGQQPCAAVALPLGALVWLLTPGCGDPGAQLWTLDAVRSVLSRCTLLALLALISGLRDADAPQARACRLAAGLAGRAGYAAVMWTARRRGAAPAVTGLRLLCTGAACGVACAASGLWGPATRAPALAAWACLVVTAVGASLCLWAYLRLPWVPTHGTERHAPRLGTASSNDFVCVEGPHEGAGGGDGQGGPAASTPTGHQTHFATPLRLHPSGDSSSSAVEEQYIVLASASPKGPGLSGTRRPIRGAAGLGPSGRAPVRPTIHSDPAPAPAPGSGHVCHGSPREASCDGGVGSDAGGVGGPTGTPSTAVLAAALQAYRGPNVGTLTFGAPWSVAGGGAGGGAGAVGAERARGPLHHKAPAPLVLRTVDPSGCAWSPRRQ